MRWLPCVHPHQSHFIRALWTYNNPLPPSPQANRHPHLLSLCSLVQLALLLLLLMMDHPSLPISMPLLPWILLSPQLQLHGHPLSRLPHPLLSSIVVVYHQSPLAQLLPLLLLLLLRCMNMPYLTLTFPQPQRACIVIHHPSSVIDYHIVCSLYRPSPSPSPPSPSAISAVAYALIGFLSV